MTYYTRATLLYVVLLWGACTTADPQALGIARTSSARGVVVQVNPVFVVDDAANAPVGGVPVDGASIRVLDRAGNVVGETTSGADGSFDLDGLPTGLLRAEVRVDPASTDPDVSAEFTSVPRIEIVLGKKYMIDRDAAALLALEGVPASALVVGTLQPLPPGTVIRPAAVPLFTGSSALTGALPEGTTVLESDTWFFFVDLAPGGHFAHPCEYVFVDAAGAEVTRLGEGIDFYPSVNGAGLWSGDTHFLDRDDSTATPTSEVVQDVAPVPLTPPTGGAVLAGPVGTGQEDLFLIHIAGYADDAGFQSDARNVPLLYRNFFGIPAAQIAQVSAEGKQFDTVRAELIAAFTRAQVFAKQRRIAGGKPTVVVHINSHGITNEVRDGDGPGTRPRGAVCLNTVPPDDASQHNDYIVVAADCFDLEGVDGFEAEGDRFVQASSFEITMGGTDVVVDTVEVKHVIRTIALDELGLAKTCACRVRVLVDTCYSVPFICDIEEKIDFGSAPSERPDVQLFGAGKEIAWRDDAGTWFTQRVLQKVNLVDGDITGLVNEEDELLPDLEVIQREETRQEGGYKHPEGGACETPAGSLIALDRARIENSHIVGVTECPQTIGRVQVTNTSGADVCISVRTNFDVGLDGVSVDGSLVTDNDPILLAPGESVDLDIRFLCLTTESFTDLVTIHADQKNGGEEDVGLEVRMNLSFP